MTDPALLPPSSSCNARLRMDEELIRIMTKVVNELGLEWSSPEEPSRSRLDEWFLPGCHQAPCQRLSPFFPEVHDELTKSWCATYSSRIRPSASGALTSVDGKGYELLPPLDESRPDTFRQDRGIEFMQDATPFPKRQGPQPKIALDPAPQKSY